MTTEEFSKIVEEWIATARHPKFNRLYTELIFQPMFELLIYLRANGFKTLIAPAGELNLCVSLRTRYMGFRPSR